MNIIEQSILNTLKYSSVFDFPLKSEEIYKYLISEEEVGYKKVEVGLNVLISKDKVESLKDYYLIKGESIKTVQKREKYAKKYKKLVKKVKKDLKPLFKFKFIKLIAVTGSVAAKNLEKPYDTDLFIVSSKNFLWVTRLVVVLYLKYKKVYRNKYCANIYVSIDNMIWEQKNLYVANEIARLKPVLNREYAYEKFLVKNKWIITFLPNFKHYIPKYNLNFKSSFLSFLVFPFEFLIFKLQYLYMKRKITTETVELRRILFLKNDYSNKILGEYKSS